ncbi:MAG: type II secretion system F family protein [Nocardioides sp.]|nr:type II secretion system F family protein [Nocardioides sp.]
MTAGLLLAAAVLLSRPLPLGRSFPVAVRLAGLAILVWIAVVSVPWRLLLPLVVVVGTVVALILVRARQRRAAEAGRTGERIQEVCEVMSAELAAGLPAARSLRSAADVWAPMESVAVASELGAPVSDSMRELASGPGAHDLRLVAAAWQLAHRSGAGLSEALTAVAASLREAGATRRLVRSELASARSTARLMAGLPLLTLVMGSGAGGNPLAFLLGTPLGLGCLVAGACLTVLGLWWIESIAASVESDAR